MGYYFRLAARVLLYAPSHRHDNTYHDLCYTSRGVLAGTRNSSMGPLHVGWIRRSIAPLAKALTMELHLAPQNFKPLDHYTCMQCGTSHLQTVQEKHTVTYNFIDLQEVYSGNRQIHTKCQLQYLHPPQISTSGKCHCVIIHQTPKATEYIG